MFNIENAAQAKKSARAMEKSLAKQGIDLGHGHALNILAAMAGFTDWNAMQQRLQLAPATQMPMHSILDVDFTKVDRVRAFGSEYEILDTEAFSTLQPWLANWKSALNPHFKSDPVLLVLETLNDEVYGSEELTVSEILDFKWDSLREVFVNSGGQELQPLSTTPYRFTETVSDESGTTPDVGPKTEFSILDVDFTQITGLSRGGDNFWATVADSDALKWFYDWANPVNPSTDADVEVLSLSYVDDNGFMAYEYITVEELQGLNWNHSRGAFQNDAGVEYKFAVQSVVGPDSPGLRHPR